MCICAWMSFAMCVFVHSKKKKNKEMAFYNVAMTLNLNKCHLCIKIPNMMINF